MSFIDPKLSLDKKKNNTKDLIQSNDTQKKYVLFKQYERLELKYKELYCKFKLIKTENNELKSILNEIQEHITLYQDTKNSIENLVGQVKQQYQLLLNKMKEKNVFVLSHNNFNIYPSTDNDNNTLTNMNKYTTDKDKSFKEDHYRFSLGKLVSTINSTNNKEKNCLIKNHLSERFLGALILEYENSYCKYDESKLLLGNNNNNKEGTSTVNNQTQVNEVSNYNEPMPSILKCLKKCL